MTDKRRILVTGGAGYIASHTIIELMKDDRNEIISVDNYSNSNSSTYDRIKAVTGKTVQFHECDLSDASRVKELFRTLKHLDGIIHFAAHKSVPESVANPSEYYRNNIFSLVNILQAAESSGVRDLIFSSSCSVYGNISVLPVNEKTPLSVPESPYAATKVMGEMIVRDAAIFGKKFNAISLRYFNPAGAHPSGLIGELPLNKPNNLVPVITRTAIGLLPGFTVFGNDYDTRDGTCIRDYVHVCDIARAHVLALNALGQKTNTLPYAVYNLGTGKGVTVLEAINSFEKVSGVKPKHTIGARREGDVAAIYSDCSAANAALGWKPEFDLDDMMRTAWKWEQHLAQR